MESDAEKTQTTNSSQLPQATQIANQRRGGEPQAVSILLEFRRERSSGVRLTAREFVDRRGITEPELIVDLAFAEFLETEPTGTSGLEERLCAEFPQFAAELRRQISFHRALQQEDSSPTLNETVDWQDSRPSVGEPDFSFSRALPEIPGLVLIRQLGRGGMGVVYLAEQAALSRHVAVKFLLGGALASPEHRARFRAEAQLAAALHHPNIVQVYEVGEVGGQPYLVLEYVAGGTLDSRLKGERPHPREAAEFIGTLASALHEAHKLGILHRDLKPGNILLAQAHSGGAPLRWQPPEGPGLTDLIPKIADFGLAKVQRDEQGAAGPPLTLAGDILGTPSYMAPEQTQGNGFGPWTDIYSLGAILYELLAGRPPYLAATPWETLQLLMTDDPPALSREVPLDLRTICHKCLSRKPADRYSSMQFLADDLQRFLNREPILARRVNALERTISWCQRNRIVTTLGCIILLTLSTLLAVSLRSRARLQSLLEDMASGQQRESAAHGQALSRLWESLISEAKAQQSSGQIGQKTKSLEAIGRAIELLPAVGNTGERQTAIRNAAIASLALTDLQRLDDWHGSELPNGVLIATDDQFHRVAQLVAGEVIVSEELGRKSVCRIPAANARFITLSGNGRWLAAFGDQCQVFDLDESEPRIAVEFASLGYWGFSPDSNSLVGCGQEGLVVYDLDRRQTVHRLSPCVSEFPLAFARDNRKLAIVNGAKIIVFDYVAGRALIELPAGQAITGNHCLAWHPNSRHLAAAVYDDRLIALWDSESGEQVRSYPQQGVSFSLGFDRSGEYLLSCSEWDGCFNVYSVESETKLLTLQGSSSSRLVPLEASVRMFLSTEKSRYDIWEFRPQNVLRSLPTESGKLTPRIMSAVDPSGKWLVVATGEGLEFYSTSPKRRIAELPIGSIFNGRIGFDREGRLWACQPNGWLRWELQQSRLSAPDFIPTATDHWPIELDPTGAWTLTSNSWEVRLESLVEPGRIIPLGGHEDVRNGSFSPDGKLVATGAWNGRDTKIWRVADGSLVKILKTGPISSPRFSPDGRWLITSPDGGVVWNTRTWEEQLWLNSPGSAASGMAFAFSPDSRWLVSSRTSGELQLWNIENRQFLGSLKDPNQLRCEWLTFSPDQTEIFVCSKDERGILSVWNLEQVRRELATLEISLPLAPQQPPTELMSEPVQSPTLKIEANQVLNELLARKLGDDANKLINAGDWAKGLGLFQRAAEASPRDARILNSWAWNLLVCPENLRSPRQSLDLARQAVEVDGQSIYLNTLGTAQYRCGLFAEAIETLQQSLGDGSAESAAFDYWVLACCHAKLGQLEQAEQLFAGGAAAEERVRGLVGETWSQQMKLFRAEAESALAELRK